MMASLRTPLLLLLAALALSSVQAKKRGDGTAYSGDGEIDKTGFNSCQFSNVKGRWRKFYCALPSHSFDKGDDCGRCIRARGLNDEASGDWVTVKVVDECADCEGAGDVDFSTAALKAITNFAWDRKEIEWEWTSCDGGRKLLGDDGSNPGETFSGTAGLLQE